MLKRALGATKAALSLKWKRVAGDALQLTLFIGGLASVAYGCWMLYHPLGPIVGGVFAVKLSNVLAQD